MTKHKHAELIKAWADGAQIQQRPPGLSTWMDIGLNGYTIHWSTRCDYRIKPEPRPDFVEKRTIFYNESFKTVDIFEHSLCLASAVQVAFTFDGETGKLKSVEII